MRRHWRRWAAAVGGASVFRHGTSSGRAWERRRATGFLSICNDGDRNLHNATDENRSRSVVCSPVNSYIDGGRIFFGEQGLWRYLGHDINEVGYRACSCFEDRTKACQQYRQVVESVPLESLRHVKWVRRRIAKGEVELSVILRLADEYKEDSEAIPEAFISLSMLIVCVFLKQKFPSILLNQKKNGEEQNKIWPTSYHPSTNLDGVATPSEGDLQMIFKYMKVVIQMSKLSYIGGEVLNAAIIVDPMHGQIIANGYDHTHPRPSTRATITGHGCNDGCGVTTESDESNSSELGSSQNVIVRTFSLNKCSKKSAGVSFLNPWEWTAQKPTNQISMSRSKSKYTGHPLQHEALVAIENAAARDRKLFPGSGSSECQPEIVDRLLCTPDKSLSERQKKHCSVEEVADKSESSEVLRPYLCTGFDIYLGWEPCMMCAMALVHQRIRRICYALPNPHAGALGSVYRLHGQKSLNHHYSVFRILIPEQDLELMESNASDSS